MGFFGVSVEIQTGYWQKTFDAMETNGIWREYWHIRPLSWVRGLRLVDLGIHGAESTR